MIMVTLETSIMTKLRMTALMVLEILIKLMLRLIMQVVLVTLMKQRLKQTIQKVLVTLMKQKKSHQHLAILMITKLILKKLIDLPCSNKLIMVLS